MIPSKGLNGSLFVCYNLRQFFELFFIGMNDIVCLFFKRFTLQFSQFLVFLDLLLMSILNGLNLDIFSVDRISELLFPDHFCIKKTPL